MSYRPRLFSLQSSLFRFNRCHSQIVSHFSSLIHPCRSASIKNHARTHTTYIRIWLYVLISGASSNQPIGFRHFYIHTLHSLYLYIVLLLLLFFFYYYYSFKYAPKTIFSDCCGAVHAAQHTQASTHAHVHTSCASSADAPCYDHCVRARGHFYIISAGRT